MLQHPAGIQTEGNLLLFSDRTNCRDAGLGVLAVLSDAQVLDILGYLSAPDIARLACVSKALYCFCDHEDLWKAAVLEEFGGDFRWVSTWRQSYAASLAARQHPYNGNACVNGNTDLHDASPPGDAAQQQDDQPASTAPKSKKGKKERGKKRKKHEQLQACPLSEALDKIKRAIRVTDFYSDLLYQPWHCATVDIDPSWLEVDNIDRVANLTWQEFHTRFEVPNQPVVLTGAAAAWPAIKKWDINYLRTAYGDRPVIAGNFKLPFPTYAAYAESTCDEMPLYLFDKHFASAASNLAQDFSVPSVFKEDLLSCLGDTRPDYRWLIAGPARSGSSFHIDPNATSAWNAVVSGRKKWIMYPPGVIPPGVHPSADGSEVATPVSIIEWFLNFYDDTKDGKVQPLECVVEPGDAIFVPSGWWHACLNLDTWTIAVTQNFVSSANLSKVLDFLNSRSSDLVSGCAHEQRGALYDRFFAAMKETHPHLLEVIEKDKAVARARAEQAKKLSSLFKQHTSAAAAASDGHTQKHSAGDDKDTQQGTNSTGFSFGFGVGSGSDASKKGAPDRNGGGGGGGGGFSFGFSL